MERNSIFVLVSAMIANFVFECGSAEYEFGKIELVKSFTCALPGDVITKKMVDEYPLHKLNREEKWRLCVVAKEHAMKNGVVLRSVDFDEEQVNKCTIYKYDAENGTSAKEDVGLRCPFIPSVLLSLVANSDPPTIATTVQKNPFMNERYEFYEEVVDNAKYLVAIGSDSKTELRENFLYAKLNYRTRWEMCVAATKRIRHNVTALYTDDWSEIVGVYDISYADGTKTQYVAFPCHSSPKMYLRTDAKHKYVAMLERY